MAAASADATPERGTGHAGGALWAPRAVRGARRAAPTGPGPASPRGRATAGETALPAGPSASGRTPRHGCRSRRPLEPPRRSQIAGGRRAWLAVTRPRQRPFTSASRAAAARPARVAYPSLSRSAARSTTPPVRRERPATAPPSAARDVPAATGSRASTAETRRDRRQTGRRPRRATEPSGLPPGRDLDHPPRRRHAASRRGTRSWAPSPVHGSRCTARPRQPTARPARHRQYRRRWVSTVCPPPRSISTSDARPGPAAVTSRTPHQSPVARAAERSRSASGTRPARRPGRSAIPWPVAVRLAGSPARTTSNPAARPTIGPSRDQVTPFKFHVTAWHRPAGPTETWARPLPPCAAAAATNASTTTFSTAAPTVSHASRPCIASTPCSCLH
jgi:hypothetical protein